MAKNECEKKLSLIQAVILLDEQFSELISRFFSDKSKQDLLNKTIIQNMRIDKKREIIKSIIVRYPKDVKNIDEWCNSAVTCIQIRNAVAHKLPEGDNYILGINGKVGKYSVDDLTKIFRKCWGDISPSITSILNKLKDDDLLGDVVLVRVSLRNYKRWFNDIYNVEIEDSDGMPKELDDYPDRQYNTEEYEEEVKSDIKDWLIKKKVNMNDVDIEVYLDWHEEPD